MRNLAPIEQNFSDDDWLILKDALGLRLALSKAALAKFGEQIL